MALSKRILLVACFAVASIAECSFYQRFCILALKSFSDIVYPANLSNIPFQIVTDDSKNHAVLRHLGSGRAAVVSQMLESPDGTPRIFKIARRIEYNEDVVEEWDFFQANRTEFAGRVIPIYAKHKSKDGREILEKPYFENISLFKLIKSRSLTDHQLDSLRETLNWLEDYVQKTKKSLDINPFNLTWVSDPKVLAAMGREKAGFVFYELTKEMPRWQYVLYLKYLRKLSAYSRSHRIDYQGVEAKLPADVESLQN